MNEVFFYFLYKTSFFYPLSIHSISIQNIHPCQTGWYQQLIQGGYITHIWQYVNKKIYKKYIKSKYKFYFKISCLYHHKFKGWVQSFKMPDRKGSFIDVFA